MNRSFLISLLAMLCASLAVGPGASAQDALANFDSDADGSLNAAEFKVFIDAAADAGRGQAARVRDNNRYGMAFSRIDRDGNGLVSAEELASMQ